MHSSTRKNIGKLAENEFFLKTCSIMFEACWDVMKHYDMLSITMKHSETISLFLWNIIKLNIMF